MLLQQPVGPQQGVAQALHAVHALAAAVDESQGRRRKGRTCACSAGQQPEAASLIRGSSSPLSCSSCQAATRPAAGQSPHLSSSISPSCLNSRRKSSISWLQRGRGGARTRQNKQGSEQGIAGQGLGSTGPTGLPAHPAALAGAPPVQLAPRPRTCPLRLRWVRTAWLTGSCLGRTPRCRCGTAG